MRYINYNGNIYPEHEPLLPVTNRGFRYGDSFFETMVMFNKKLPLLEYHWGRLVYTADVLNMQLPKRFGEELFKSMLLDLIAVNNDTENARVRLQVFRDGGGLYLPEENEAGYTISMESITNGQFECGPGLLVGTRQDCYKPLSMTSDLKTSNALMYVMAAKLAKAEGWDECLLLNNAENLSEAIHSNIFLVNGDKLITPDLDSGCVNGVMRGCLMALLMDYEIEEREVLYSELATADELLLTNAVKGIQWVRELNGKTYGNKKAVELTAFLNNSLL